MARKALTTYSVTQAQIVAGKRGWFTLTLSDGATVTVRKSQIVLVNGMANRRVGSRRYDCRKYEKVASVNGHASLDNGDELATKLRGTELDDVYKLAAQVLGETQRTLRAKYAHLNVGMQRMNLGNRIRAAQGAEA